MSDAFDAIATFGIQASEIEARWTAVVARDVSEIPRAIDATAPTLASAAFSRAMLRSMDRQTDFLSQYAIEAGHALPRFLGRRTAERTVESSFDPDEADPPEEEEPDGLADDLLRALLALLLWNGATIRQQQIEFVARQELAFLQAVRAAWSIASRGGVDLGAGADAAVRAARRHVVDRTVPDAVALARTHFQAVTNEVVRLTAQANGERYVGFRWTAILDLRTCLRCGVLDGKFYALDAAVPIPLHPRCRCLLVPVTTRVRPKRATFPEWFARRPASFQRSLLGDKRYAAWRAGDLTFRDFVQFRNRVPARVRTLAELVEA